MRAIVERHGGTVEKFIGDAVMAVFGVPVVARGRRAARRPRRRRDARRTPRAGARGPHRRHDGRGGDRHRGAARHRRRGQRRRPARAGRRARRGADRRADTGARRRTPSRSSRSNRSCSRARPSRSPRTGCCGCTTPRSARHDTRFVGRDRELAAGPRRLGTRRSPSDAACSSPSSAIPASASRGSPPRLLASIDATIVRGRCLPYGDGITYWPVVESPQAARPAHPTTRTQPRRSDRCSGRATPSRAPRRSRGRFARRSSRLPLSTHSWSCSTTSSGARTRFHDLIEHAALLSTGAPILLLCMARPELVEQRPDWVVTVRLEPLTDDDVDELLPHELPGRAAREDHASGGGQSALRPRDARHGGRDRRRSRRPAHAPGAPGGASRPARERRARRARAWVDRRRGLSPRCGAGADVRRRRGGHSAARRRWCASS